MQKVLKNNLTKGFTLIELLIVMSILAVLVSIIAGGFRSSQARGRDAQRKSDFQQIGNALELFYADYGKYPDESSGKIVACSYSPTLGSTPCEWGSGLFTDGKTTYFKAIPIDPTENYDYVYRVPDSPSNQAYQLFARLENPKDQDCLADDCANPGISHSCGSKVCNFALTSPNTSATE